MADLSFYRHILGADVDGATAFSHLSASLQTYYDAAFYVDWRKVYESISGFSADLHLLSSLCHQSNIEEAARQLLCEYPKVVRAFPLLLAWRKPNISILEDAATAQIRVWNFHPKPVLNADEIEDYVQFLGESGLFDLLSNIKSVPDYATGVEVGIDTNGRKNRSGNLAIKALQPHISAAIGALAEKWQLDVEFHGERDFKWLRARNCLLADGHDRLKWDGAFHCPRTGKFVLLEVNHYGTTGSKPTAIAHEYIARERELNALGIGFMLGDGRRRLDRDAPRAALRL